MSIKEPVYKKYREDSNKDAFAVAAVEKIYAHESLTFNNTVACEVISKWKAGLKDDMDARSDVYAEIWATKGLLDKAKGNVLGMKIVKDQSGNTLRVSHSRFYNEKLKKKIWLKGLLTESRYELRLATGIATGALVKGGSRSEVSAQVEVAAYRY
nr:zinc finger, CCHC-type [Tanacetum cinerariifolium]